MVSLGWKETGEQVNSVQRNLDDQEKIVGEGQAVSGGIPTEE